MIDQIEFNALSECDKWRYYRDASEKCKRMEKVVEAAKFNRKAWNQNREEIYRRLGEVAMGSVMPFDPDFRHLDRLGLNESLKALELEPGDSDG